MQINLFFLGGIIFAVLLAVYGDQEMNRSDEWKLMQKLFSNYSKDLRPSTPVKISLDIAFVNLDSVDPKKEKIGLNVWFRMVWIDDRLRWNLSQYSVTSLTVKFRNIWTPDMVLYSAVGTLRDFGVFSPDDLELGVVVDNNGSIFFSQPVRIDSACAMNIADFPFDDQECKITFGSWAMDNTLMQLDLTKGDGIDLSPLTKNNMWDVLDIYGEVLDQGYSWRDNPFSNAVYRIKVRRKSLFYVVNYILPPVAITLLSLLLFLIPPEVGKRMEAGINLLLCLSVYLLLVNSKMPSTSTAFPLLTKFYACAIIILVLAMCCTCLVYALYFMNSSGLEIHDAAMAIRLKNFILRWLKPLLCCTPCRRSSPNLRKTPSKVNPTETGFHLNEIEDQEQEKVTERKQEEDERGATSGRDPAVTITSNSSSNILRQTSGASAKDVEGNLTLAEKRSVLEYGSSISSIDMNDEDNNILTTVYFSLPDDHENNANVNGDEEPRKVAFAPQKEGKINLKRRLNSRKCSNTEHAQDQTDETLVCSAGSSWFSYSPCEDLQETEFGQSANKIRNDISGCLVEEIKPSKGLVVASNEKKSNTDGRALGLLDHLALSVEAEKTKNANTQQWQKAAMVLDRMFIIVLFTSITVSFIASLLLAPRVRHVFILS